jgi:hypothetical protein
LMREDSFAHGTKTTSIQAKMTYDEKIDMIMTEGVMAPCRESQVQCFDAIECHNL